MNKEERILKEIEDNLKQHRKKIKKCMDRPHDGKERAFLKGMLTEVKALRKLIKKAKQ